MSANTSSQTELHVIARAPFHIHYEGTAHIVSATNNVGPFDILPGHADFFSILSPGEVTIENDSESIEFTITNGIISVHNNQVLLFVNM